MISGPLLQWHGISSGCGWRKGLQIWTVAANMLNKHSQTAKKGWSSSLGFGRGVNNSSPQKLKHVTNHTQKPWNWTDPSVHPKQWKRDMRFGKWNLRSLYRSGSFTTIVMELARYKLDLVGVQEVRWDKAETVRAGDYTLVYRKGNENQLLGTGFFIHQRIVDRIVDSGVY